MTVPWSPASKTVPAPAPVIARVYGIYDERQPNGTINIWS